MFIWNEHIEYIVLLIYTIYNGKNLQRVKIYCDDTHYKNNYDIKPPKHNKSKCDL